MPGPFRHAILAAAFASCAMAQGVLEPPFGLLWGDSPEKLMDWATRHSLDVNLSLPGDQPALRVLRIQPRKGFLPESRASAVEARFLAGKLFEVTVHYSDPEASADHTAGRFEEIRREAATKYGAFRTNREERSVDDQFATRTRSFHREPVKGVFLLLAFTEVEDLLRKSREARFSLVYRNDNFRQEILRTLGRPATKAGPPQKDPGS